MAGFELTRNYREAYGLHASTGILFNHESPRRGYEFVTRKITAGLAMILAGKADNLRLGNLEAQRDWGHAADYVRAMWQMLQQEEPGDYVIGTGKTHSVREFAQLAFEIAGLDYTQYVKTDAELYRPAEVDLLIADPSHAREKLGWRSHTSFRELVRQMVHADCANSGVSVPKSEPLVAAAGPAF